jgi:hypothetical protein
VLHYCWACSSSALRAAGPGCWGHVALSSEELYARLTSLWCTGGAAAGPLPTPRSLTTTLIDVLAAPGLSTIARVRIGCQCWNDFWILQQTQAYPEQACQTHHFWQTLKNCQYERPYCCRCLVFLQFVAASTLGSQDTSTPENTGQKGIGQP